nr:Uncharacterised protein [Klebsiella pneumoniae]
MASRALRRPVHFPVIFYACSRQLILTSKESTMGNTLTILISITP